MSQVHYEEILNKLESLIEEKEFKKAKRLVEKELSMSYVPPKFENTFFELRNIINSELASEEKINNLLSIEEIFKAINLSTPKEDMAIAQLKNFNLSDENNIKNIKLIFSNSSINFANRGIIYQYLIEQNIDKEFIIDDEKINPLKTGSLFKREEFLNAYKYLEEKLSQNPTALQISFDMLHFYILYSFPQFIKEKIDLGKIFESLTLESLGLEPTLEDGYDKNKIRKIITHNL